MIQRASKIAAMKLKIFFCCTFYEEIGTIINDFIMKIAEMDKLRYTILVTNIPKNFPQCSRVKII